MKLIINLPGSSVGEPVDVNGLGRLQNGYQYDLTDELVERMSGFGFPPQPDENGNVVVGVMPEALNPPPVDKNTEVAPEEGE